MATLSGMGAGYRFDMMARTLRKAMDSTKASSEFLLENDVENLLEIRRLSQMLVEQYECLMNTGELRYE